MSLTNAYAEALAANPAGVSDIHTIQLDNVAFAEPAYIACGVQEDIDLPLTLGGTPVTHRALAMSVVPPGVDGDGKPTPLQITFDNAANLLLPYARLAAQSSSPIDLTYRVYTTADLTQPGEVTTGLRMASEQFFAATVRATVAFPAVETQAFPLAVYDEEYYPDAQGL